MWRSAARVHEQPCPRQFLHQRTGAAGVVQMHVRGDHPVHRVARQAQGFQRPQQARHGVGGAGVDEGGAAAVHDQVGGVEAVAVEAGVDGVDAVAEGFDVGGQGGRHAGIVRDCRRSQIVYL